MTSRARSGRRCRRSERRRCHQPWGRRHRRRGWGSSPGSPPECFRPRGCLPRARPARSAGPMSAKPSWPGRSVAYAANGPPSEGSGRLPEGATTSTPCAPVGGGRRAASDASGSTASRDDGDVHAQSASLVGEPLEPGDEVGPRRLRRLSRAALGPAVDLYVDDARPGRDADRPSSRPGTSGDQAGHRRAVVVAGVHDRPGAAPSAARRW